MMSLTHTEEEVRALPPGSRAPLVAERILALTGASGAAVALRDESGAFRCRARAGESAPRVGTPLSTESGISGACIRNHEIIRCEDAWRDERVNTESARRIKIRSVLAVPLMQGGVAVGMVQALSARPYAFSVSDLERLKKLGSLLVEDFPLATTAAAPEIHEVATPAVAEPAPDAEPVAVAPVVIIEPEPAPVQAAVEASEQEGAPEPHADNVIEFPAHHEPEPEPVPEPVAEAPAPAAEAELEASPAAPEHKGDLLEMPAPAAPERSWLEEPVAAESFETVGEPMEMPNHRAHWEPPQPVFTPTTSEVLFQAFTAPRRSRRKLWLALGLLLFIAAAVYWFMQSGKPITELLQTMRPAQPAPVARTAGQAAPVSSAAAAPVEPAAPATSTPAPAVVPAAIPPTPPADAGPRTLTGIRVTREAGRTVVLIDLTDQTQYEEHRLGAPDRIYFDLQETALAHGVPAKLSGDGGSLLRVRAASPQPGVTRVVLDTNGNVDYRVRLNTEPYGLRIEMGPPSRETPKAVASAPKPVAPPIAALPKPTTRLAAGKLKIVLDPGHGGWDMGTIGSRGLMEKDMALDVAQRLGQLLQKNPDYDVTLTRQDDSYIPLEQRASSANAAGADLFISIHGNYSSRGRARGVETYYPVAATADAAASTRAENSRKLAALLQTFLHHQEEIINPGLPDRGVKAANYAVLRSTAMPAALAEVSFVSSPNDEKQLIQPSYRQQLAEALYKGIASYVNQRNQRLTASAGARSSGQ